MGTMNVFSQRLKEQRKKKGLDQSELGAKLDVTRGSISFYENGDRVPNIEFLYKASKFFGVTADYLLGLSEVMIKDTSVDSIQAATGLSEVASIRLCALKGLWNGELSSSSEAGDYYKRYQLGGEMFLEDLLCSDEFLTLSLLYRSLVLNQGQNQDEYTIVNQNGDSVIDDDISLSGNDALYIAFTSIMSKFIERNRHIHNTPEENPPTI